MPGGRSFCQWQNCQWQTATLLAACQQWQSAGSSNFRWPPQTLACAAPSETALLQDTQTV